MWHALDADELKSMQVNQLQVSGDSVNDLRLYALTFIAFSTMAFIIGSDVTEGRLCPVKWV